MLRYFYCDTPVPVVLQKVQALLCRDTEVPPMRILIYNLAILNSVTILFFCSCILSGLTIGIITEKYIQVHLQLCNISYFFSFFCLIL